MYDGKQSRGGTIFNRYLISSEEEIKAQLLKKKIVLSGSFFIREIVTKILLVG
jgi:hypothetical protein